MIWISDILKQDVILFHSYWTWVSKFPNERKTLMLFGLMVLGLVWGYWDHELWVLRKKKLKLEFELEMAKNWNQNQKQELAPKPILYMYVFYFVYIYQIIKFFEVKHVSLRLFFKWTSFWIINWEGGGRGEH